MVACAQMTEPQTYSTVRALTEQLADPLSPEDQTVQSMADTSPAKWHRAHTTWFFEEFLLGKFASWYEPYHPSYRYLFNSYYEAVGPRHPRPARGVVSRPGVDEIGRYRRAVDTAMMRLLDDYPRAEVEALVGLGLNHEQQHQELLLMDIKHVLSCNPLASGYRSVAPVAGEALPMAVRWVDLDGGLVEVGHDGDGFAFDNETPRHRVYIEPFTLASRPVTCGEWAAFIDDGGYGKPEVWLSDGWAAVRAEGWEAPLYWRRASGDEWTVFTLGGERPLCLDEPVCHVSYYEADAYARWSGARLPTEAEWEHAVGGMLPFRQRFDLDALHPRPCTGPGLEDSVGEVWEWTASPYAPYPGFRPLPGAVGEYNGKFMVNQYVLRGGACVTPPGHARATYRNFFPPGARWPFTGVRLAQGG
jgi:ergothioneine biosynthesis protein EgtB